MQVGTVGGPGVAHETDEVADLDGLTDDQRAGVLLHVGVDAVDVLPVDHVADHHVVAEAAVVVGMQGHHTVGDRVDGCTGTGGEVDAVVERPAGDADVAGAEAVSSRHRVGEGPPNRTRGGGEGASVAVLETKKLGVGGDRVPVTREVWGRCVFGDDEALTLQRRGRDRWREHRGIAHECVRGHRHRDEEGASEQECPERQQPGTGVAFRGSRLARRPRSLRRGRSRVLPPRAVKLRSLDSRLDRLLPGGRGRTVDRLGLRGSRSLLALARLAPSQRRWRRGRRAV